MKKKSLPIVIGCAVGAMLFIFIIVGWFIPLPTNSTPFEAVNAIFSGLAFVGLIVAVYLQSLELAEQRKELELTRNELRGQKEQLDIQNKTFFKDNFEATFHQLIRTHLDIVDSIVLNPGANIPVKGRHVFLYLKKYTTENYEKKKIAHPNQDEYFYAREGFLWTFNTHQQHIDRFVNHLSLLLYFIDQSKFETKQLYIDILSANLSANELFFYFYYCLFVSDSNFKDLLERNGFFKYLNSKDLLQIGHKDFYQPIAFGRK